MILLLEIRVSQNLAKLGGGEGGGGDIKYQGLKGERFRVNCVALEGGFQHRLYKYWKVIRETQMYFNLLLVGVNLNPVLC